MEFRISELGFRKSAFGIRFVTVFFACIIILIVVIHFMFEYMEWFREKYPKRWKIKKIDFNKFWKKYVYG